MGIIVGKVQEQLPIVNAISESLKNPPLLSAGVPDNRQRLIQRQGCIQHSVISQAIFSNTTNDAEWWALVEKNADRMIEYINRG